MNTLEFRALRAEWNQRLKEGNRTCEWCGTAIEGTARRKYCTPAHRLAAHRAKRQARADHEEQLNDMTESLGYLPTWSRQDMASFFGMHVLPRDGAKEQEYTLGMPDTDDGETYLGIEVIGSV